MRLELLKIEIARDFAKKREPGTGNHSAIRNFYTSTRRPSHKTLMNAPYYHVRYSINPESKEISESYLMRWKPQICGKLLLEMWNGRREPFKLDDLRTSVTSLA